jgi:hypothetical protein
VAKADNQTGLASGSLPTWACQEIALGVYSIAVTTLPRVALWGPCGSFFAVNDWRVGMMLTWPWWSLEGSLLAGVLRIGHSPKRKFSFCSNSSVGVGFEFKVSQANGPIYAVGPCTLEEEKKYVFLIIENYDLKDYMCVECVPTRRVPIYRNSVYFWGNT